MPCLRLQAVSLSNTPASCGECDQNAPTAPRRSTYVLLLLLLTVKVVSGREEGCVIHM